ncbi:hypothetical protein FISHEDRAFT_36199 [Fistulina hepatica ATCC 64428]|uniref:MIP18 family-like domain-containing protein n=1 Tax=Fistulina hepatica ATCC 64428 TaxID=1128425 RepID=A0A0D7AJU6_9AGAR|nr:hypothetical protein FISHEDRAFT_36199 [Fistulina hepatica ATCC 64428]
MVGEIFNPNPTIFSPVKASRVPSADGRRIWMDDADSDNSSSYSGEDVEPIDNLIRHITDPEYTDRTLEELRVVSAPQITVSDECVDVEFTPTVPHCGMSTLIGLSIRVRLIRSLPSRFKIDIHVKPGSHQSEHAVNKQLNDKERVAAALENQALVNTLEQCLADARR